jgi:hypothetical protein
LADWTLAAIGYLTISIENVTDGIATAIAAAKQATYDYARGWR